MPKVFDELNNKFKHHLILKCDQKIFDEVLKISKNIFPRKKTRNNFEIFAKQPSPKAL